MRSPNFHYIVNDSPSTSMSPSNTLFPSNLTETTTLALSATSQNTRWDQSLRYLLRDLSIEDLASPHRIRQRINVPQIPRWDPRHRCHFPTIRDNTDRFAHDNSENNALKFSGRAFATLLQLHIHRQLSRIFQLLHYYRWMIIPIPLTKRRYIHSAIQASSLLLRTYALRGQYYLKNSYFLSSTKFSATVHLAWIFVYTNVEYHYQMWTWTIRHKLLPPYLSSSRGCLQVFQVYTTMLYPQLPRQQFLVWKSFLTLPSLVATYVI